MKSFIYFCYVNVIILLKDPKVWANYIKFCIRNKKLPNIILLKKAIMVAKLTKEIRKRNVD